MKKTILNKIGREIRLMYRQQRPVEEIEARQYDLKLMEQHYRTYKEETNEKQRNEEYSLNIIF